MLTEERRQIIMSILVVHGTVSLVDLSRTVRASEVTVRRDLRALESSGLIVRHRGGASVTRLGMDEPTFRDKSQVASDEKQAIAGLAATLVEDGEVVMLLAGTTTQALAQRLVRRRLMIVTNSVLVADALCDARDVEVVLLGGVLRGSIRGVVGGDAESHVSRFRFDKVFMSGNGISARNGLSTPNAHVASIDRRTTERSRRVVVLADHTKVGIDSPIQTIPPDRIDVLVTDSSAPADEVESFREAGISVMIADARPHP